MNESVKGFKSKNIQTVVEKLRREEFPIDRQSVNDAVGDIEVEDSFGHLVPVRTLMNQIQKDEFRTPEEVMKEIHLVLGHIKSKAA